MKKENLPKAAITIWRIRLTLIVILLALIFGALAEFNKKISAFLIFITFFIYVYIILFYFVDKYWNQSYYIGLNELCVKKGVYFKNSKYIFFDKIQYVKIIISPDQRIFGLCTVYFFTSGENIFISNIEYKKVLDIQKGLNLNEKD